MRGGVNLYGYASGDPINSRDPFGLCDTCDTCDDEDDGDDWGGFDDGFEPSDPIRDARNALVAACYAIGVGASGAEGAAKAISDCLAKAASQIVAMEDEKRKIAQRAAEAGGAGGRLVFKNGKWIFRVAKVGGALLSLISFLFPTGCAGEGCH